MFHCFAYEPGIGETLFRESKSLRSELRRVRTMLLKHLICCFHLQAYIAEIDMLEKVHETFQQ